MTQYWLMKSEPDVYSIKDLKKDKKSMWEGVRNYQARNFMRDEMRIGDLVIFYHSNAKPPAAVGVAKVVSKPYPDPTQFDSKSPYYDPKSTKENPRWVLIDVGFVKEFRQYITLNEMREVSALSQMQLLKKGNRLSILPLTKKEFEKIVAMGKAS